MPLERRPPLFTYDVPTMFHIAADEAVASQLIVLGNVGDSLAAEWLLRLSLKRKAARTLAIQDAIEEAGKIRPWMLPTLDPNGDVEFVLSFSNERTEKTALYAWTFLRLAKSDLGHRVSQCQRKDCGKWFLAPDRREAKWCSNACGNLSRVRKFLNKKRRTGK